MAGVGLVLVLGGCGAADDNSLEGEGSQSSPSSEATATVEQAPPVAFAFAMPVTVLDPNGLPIVTATVTVVGASSPLPVDPAGIARLTVSSPGDYAITASAPNYLTGRIDDTVYSDGAAPQRITLRYAPPNGRWIHHPQEVFDDTKLLELNVTDGSALQATVTAYRICGDGTTSLNDGPKQLTPGIENDTLDMHLSFDDLKLVGPGQLDSTWTMETPQDLAHIGLSC